MSKLKIALSGTPKINFGARKQRLKLYDRAYGQHTTETKLFTLQNKTINLIRESSIAALNPSKENLLSLASAVGHVEMWIEIVKHSIPNLHEAANSMIFKRLDQLHKATIEAEAEARKISNKNKIAPETVKASEEFNKLHKQKKGFLHFLKYLLRYFKNA